MKRGFTLLELAIVLAIIGLLAGGTLYGKELIAIAQVRKATSQLNEYILAANAFRNKYNCLPGDCANAVNLGLGTTGGLGRDGDGNNIIDLYGTYESANFFYHLMRANLIAESVPGAANSFSFSNSDELDFPKLLGNYVNAAYIVAVEGYPSSLIEYYDGAAQNNFAFSKDFGAGNDFCQRCPFSPPQIYAIDNKIDDGMPKSGLLQAAEIGQFDDKWGTASEVSGSGDGCINTDNSPNRYNVKNNNTNIENLCTALMKLPF